LFVDGGGAQEGEQQDNLKGARVQSTTTITTTTPTTPSSPNPLTRIWRWPSPKTTYTHNISNGPLSYLCLTNRQWIAGRTAVDRILRRDGRARTAESSTGASSTPSSFRGFRRPPRRKKLYLGRRLRSQTAANTPVSDRLATRTLPTVNRS
jgi:hypothetical protein